MIAWLRRAAAAADLASDRSDLWPAASLASLAYLGWVPLLAAVAPPRAGDLAYQGTRLVSSGSYPANVLALALAVVGAFMLLCLLAAMGEVAVTRAFRPAAAELALGRSTLSAMAVMLLATIPAMLAMAWLALAAIEIAPTVYGAPGAEASFFTRLAAMLVPQLLVLAAAILAGQAIGGVALRRAIGVAGDDLGTALWRGLRDIVRRPWPWLGIAAVAWLKDVILLLLTWLLLRQLWEPIGDSVGPGLLTAPELLVLLVGFVAIWLILLLVGGATHAFVSAWWLIEARANQDGSEPLLARENRPEPGMPGLHGGEGR